MIITGAALENCVKSGFGVACPPHLPKQNLKKRNNITQIQTIMQNIY